MRLARFLAFAVVIALAACGGESDDGEAPTAAPAALMEAGPLGDEALGNPAAPVTVIEYASMTCPHCRAFHEDVFDDFIAQYVDTGRVYFIFREFPLDPAAAAAAAIARCAPGDDAFFGLVDLFFETQPTWAAAGGNYLAALTAVATQAGLTAESVQACLSNQDIIDGIYWNYDRGTELGVNATPTFFIDGERYPGELSLERLGELVAAAE